MKNFLLVFVSLTTTFSFGLINLNTWIKVEQGAFDAKSISMKVSNNGEVISSLFFDSFQSSIIDDKQGTRYYINTNQGLFGNTRLGYGLNLISIEFETLTSKNSQNLEVLINENVSYAELNLMVGMNHDSLSYLKDMTVSRIISNPKEIQLSFVSPPKLNKPIVIKIQNNSSDTLFGNVNRQHFMGKINTDFNGIGWIRYSPYLNCIPDSTARPLPPGASTLAIVTNEKNCTEFLITDKGKYLFEITLNKIKYNDTYDPLLIESGQTRFRILDQYWVTLEFTI